ncbi:hypothetical protein FACS1894168_0950 [Deltaproteobacteria bacterium]|nr:hypothetical protein FACS1894168_0950 [Deltaproteobacteria bacterium]
MVFILRYFSCIALALMLVSCAGRVPTDTIRASLASGNLDSLEKEMEKTHESYGEMVTALNLARIHQLNGHWKESINAYTEALISLEEYEKRAIINAREIASTVGTIFFSRGARSYFGAGYERSLLHTLNSLNYAMLGDFTGAAVEMRRMEERQTLWLDESQARIEKYLHEKSAIDSPDNLPQAYSMRDILRNDDVRRLVNNYQDPFSYALGAVFFRLADDMPAAEVSMRRAAALDENANLLFTGFSPPVTPNLPEAQKKTGKKKTSPSSSPPEAAAPAAFPEISPNSGLQEVTVIAFTGLAPALYVENIRVWIPPIGSILIDLPAYKEAVQGASLTARDSTGTPLTFYPLLKTDLLAYRTLWDEVRLEWSFAASRAITRAGAAAGTYILASSNDNTRAFASLISSATSLLMDLFAQAMSGSVRNWETLPNAGFLAMTHVPRGGSVTIGAHGAEKEISLPPDARGVIIMATEIAHSTMRIYYVAY